MIAAHGIEDLKFSFQTAEAERWYNPLKDYTLLEYQWVRSLPLEGQVVLDAGCHHGNYAVVFKGCKYIACIDSIPYYAAICRDNLALNGMAGYSKVYSATMKPHHGAFQIAGVHPDIYKMDIEGMEFHLFPREYEEQPQVHTWIIEIHPGHGVPDAVANMFVRDGFEVLKVCREMLRIRPYTIGEHWPTHATLIARRQ